MIAVRIILWLIILGVLASPLAAWYGLDDKPLVTKTHKVGVEDLKAAKDFLNQYDPRNIPDGKITRITANQRQINAALAGALAAAPMLKAQIVPSRYGLLGAVTGEIPVPDNPFGRFVNMRMLIEPSAEGLRIGRLSIGDIEIPSAVVRPTFIVVMDQLAGPGRGKAFLETIRSVEVTGDQITIVYAPKAGLIDDIKGAAKTVVAAADPEIAKVYWARVHELYESLPKSERVSLTRFMKPMFELVQRRSASGNPVEENKGAIFAMAMFFADIRVERFIGKVREGKYSGAAPKTSHVVLQGRHDWIQHYLLSAALKFAGGRGITDFIGEVKELGDTGKESGFSFTDIGADRAGVRLAEVLTESPDRARRSQQILAAVTEEPVMFPEVRDFPEGLTEEQFRARYGDRGTPEFNKLIEEMDRRIAAIPLYR
jgi:hypothetical protein